MKPYSVLLAYPPETHDGATQTYFEHVESPNAWCAVDAVQKRLTELEAWLAGRDYLEGRFTAGDLLMTTVLRILRHTNIVSERPALLAYQTRCEARPAFKKALADHLRPFQAHAA